MYTERLTILLVEDEELLALTESRWLKRAGYNCIHVFSGEKAIETVNSGNFEIDLILMDIDLGNGIDGTKCAELILKKHDIPILFLSSHTEKEIVEKTERLTSYGYVVKDMSDTVLLASIKMAFKLNKANQELLARKKALRLSEEKFSKAFYNSPDAISINRLEDGVYLEINKGFTRLTGYTSEEIIGRSTRIDDINFWVNKDEYKRVLLLLKLEGAINDIETEYIFKDGLIHVGLSSANVIELNGEECVLFITRDITERKRIEEELRLSEQRFKGITDNLPGEVFQFYARKNGETGFYYVSEKSTELLGLSSKPAESLLERFKERIAPEDRDKLSRSIKASIESVTKWEFEGKFIKTNGDEIYLKGLAQPRQVKEEVIFDGVLLDITEQKRAVESLQRVSKLQSLILDNSTVGIAFVRNRIQEWANPRMAEIFGMPIDYLNGIPTKALYPNNEAYEKLGSEAYPLLAEGKKAQLEIEMRKGDGTFFWCRLEGKAFNSSKPDDGSIWIFEDISERKRDQEALILEKTITEAIFNSVPGLIFLYDQKGNLIRWNKKHEEMTGYSSEEISNMKLLDWYKGDEKSIREITKGLNATVEKGYGEAQAELQRKDGTKIPMYFTAFYLTLKGKKYFAGIGIDVTERIKIQEGLRLSEEKMRSIFSSAPAGIGIVTNRTFVEFNDHFCEMLGYSREELFGLDTRIIYKSEEDYNYVGEESKKIFAGENYVEIEIQWKRKNGTLVDVLLCIAPIDNQNSLKGLAFTALDITERKQAEEKIRISEEKYRSLIDNMSEGLFIADQSTKILFANKAFAKIHGYDHPDYLMNRSISELVAQEAREEAIQNIVDFSGTSESEHSYVFPIKRANGSRAIVKVRPNLIREGENVLGTMGLVEDVTEQMRAEEALRISEERFRQVSETAREWIWEVDRDGFYKYSNSVVEAILGYTPEEIVGKKHFYDLWSEETKNSLWAYLKTVFHSKDMIYELEHPACHKNGNVVLLQTSGLPIVDRDGALTGYRGTDIDITQRTLAEQKLRAAETRYRSLFEQSPDGIIIIDPDTTMILDFNEVAHLQLGFSREEFSNMKISDVEAVESYAETSFHIQELMKAKSGSFETKHRTKLGEIRNVHVKTQVIEIDGKELFLCIWRDITEQKLIESELIDREQKISSLFSVTPAGMGIVKNRRFIECNERFCEMSGYTREEILGKSTRLVYISDEEYMREGIELYSELNAKGCSESEVQWRRKDGSIMYGLQYLTYIDPLDQSQGITFTILDISERKRVEEQLQIKDFALRSSLSAIGIANMDGKIFFANDSYLKLWGFTSEKEALETNITRYLPASPEVEELHKKVVSSLQNGEGFLGEGKAVRIDGTEFYVQLAANLVYSPDGKPISIMASFADITERKKSEESLNLLSHTVKSVSQGVTITDLHNNILFVNQAFLNLYGYREEEVIGNNISIIKADEYIDYDGIIESTLSGGWHGELINRRKNGTTFPVSLSTSTIQNEKGEAIGLVGVMSDITESKRVQNEIQKSYAILQATLESTGDGILVVDNNGFVIMFNNKFVSLWNLPDELHSCKDDAKLLAYVADQVLEPEIFLSKIKYLYDQPNLSSNDILELKSGRIFQRYSQPELINGKAIGRVWSFHDITELKRAEKALSENEKLVRNIIDSAPYGAHSYELKDDGRFIFISANLTATKILNRDLNALIGKPIEEAFPSLYMTGIVQKYINVATTGERYDSEYFEYDAGRIKGIFEIHAFPTGKNRMTVFFRDVTEQRKTELLVKKAQASLKAMIENINASIWSIDKNYMLVDFNNIFAEFMLKAYKVKLERGVVQEAIPRDIILFWKSKYDTALTGEQISFEFSAQLEEDMHYYEARLNPIVSDEEVTGVSVVAIDITERKKVEKELEKYQLHLETLIKERTLELEKVNILLQDEIIKVKDGEEKVKLALSREMELSDLKSRFVSTASHEFRTPLTTILASADLLEMYGRKWPDAKYLEYIHNIQNTVEYMTNLINDVLVFSKSETGKIKFNPSLVDIRQLITEIIENSKLSAPKTIRFGFEYHMEQKSLFVDHRLITQILSNLISNAIKYSPNGGKVNVSASYEKGDLLLVVTDEGIGIPDEDIGGLFEPFNRARNIGSIPGTGLGLSIVKKSVEIHNGKIMVESKLNYGTKVTVSLKCK